MQKEGFANTRNLRERYVVQPPPTACSRGWESLAVTFARRVGKILDSTSGKKYPQR
ncbi:hypothetical protein KKG52_01405 [Patescibacteria group bacterium]|nr:hypothetical protein [Patescibacteria group bacterium]